MPSGDGVTTLRVRLTPRQALMILDKELAGLAHDPAVGDAATAARAKLTPLQGNADSDAAVALAALDATPELRARLSPEGVKAHGTLEAQRHASSLRAADPEHVFLGDQANAITKEQAAGMHRVVIAGTGGTGISAAEVILQSNPTARVSMVGKEPPDGLVENTQFRSVVAKYGSPELCARLHIAPEGADGRFEFHDGVLVDKPVKTAAGYDVNAGPMADGTRLPASATQGDTYVAAIGRPNDLPPPVAELANAAERAGRAVTIKALMDKSDAFYVGYEITIVQPSGDELKIDVTGAASRYADQTKIDRDDPKSGPQMKNANDRDAPPEGPGFAGGYDASARQSVRYGSRRRDRDY